MKQVRVHGPDDVRVDEIAPPQPGPRDAVVRVAACGICGTDLSYIRRGGLAGPSGTPLALFESGAILLYLADKTRQFISADPNTRYETIQWVMWQMGGVGPMFGQVGFFHKFAGKAYEDKRPRDRYATESARLLGVLDERLTGRDWVMGADYSIADISLLGWVRNLIGFYEARELVGFDRFRRVQAWLDRGLARPAVQRGLEVTAA